MEPFSPWAITRPEGNYDGTEGWNRALDELGWNQSTGISVALLRCFLWHLMQPVMYFWVLYSFGDKIDPLQTKLGYVVAAREAVYVLLVLYGACCRATFLLVNLNARSNWEARLQEKLMYVLAPEKTVVMMLMGEGFVRWTMFIVACDCCGAAALAMVPFGHHLPPSLVVGFSATAIALAAAAAAACIAVKSGHTHEEGREERRRKEAKRRGWGSNPWAERGGGSGASSSSPTY